MALEKTFTEFSVTLLRLRDRFQELRLSVVEDRPLRNDAVVVDRYEYAVEDVLGWVNEMLQSARVAERAVQPPVDIEKARRALGVCQERMQRIERVVSESLLSYDHMKDLTAFGAERRGEWPSWVTSVRQGIDLCRNPLETVRAGMAACWQEIAERAGTTTISVTTNLAGFTAKPELAERQAQEELA